MPAASIELYQTDNTTAFTTGDFSTLSGGETSATITVHVWNAKGTATADTARNVKLRILSKLVGETEYDQDDRIDTERWVQARVNGVSDPNSRGIVSQVTAWTPMGQGRELVIDDILADAARVLELRVVMPADATASAQLQILVDVDRDRSSLALEQGHYEGGQRGMLSGYGDFGFTEIHNGGACTETGTPDNNIQVADLVWVHKGKPYIKLAHAITRTLATSGNAYWVTLSVGAGTITETASSESTDPRPVSERPAVPAGERLLAYVHVDDTAINNADIYQDDLVYGFGYLETSGLTATIGRLQALVDNRLVTINHETTVTLTDAATNTIWILPGGTLEKTTGSTAPSDDRALPIWEVTTSGAVETARKDLRTFLGPERMVLDFRFDGTLSAATFRYAAVPRDRKAYLELPNPILVAVGTTGTTSGENRFDVQYSDAGGAWTTLFTAGTGDMPKVAYDASDPANANALPEVLEIPAGSRLRVEVDAVASAGSPADGFVLLPLRMQQ